MKSSEKYKKHKQHTFDSYCSKVLKNEAIDIQRKLKNQRKYELSLSSLSSKQLNNLCSFDEYEIEYEHFTVFEYKIAIKDDNLGEVLKDLNIQERNIILMSYFLNMSDREIAKLLNMVRRTVQNKRVITLKLLRKRLEEMNL